MRSLRERSQRAGYRNTWNIGTLAAGATVQYAEHSDQLRPGLEARGEFNGISILNNSGADLWVDLDYLSGKRIVVVAHSAQSLDNMVPYLTLNVTNASTATAVNDKEVYVTVKNERDVLRERS
ncbi:MAG: hypothetical protein PHW63_09290 [Alphaproteobacteria bacterium]|nr:hypothetical protein [Alphaproteobacteria bacterium]